MSIEHFIKLVGCAVLLVILIALAPRISKGETVWERLATFTFSVMVAFAFLNSFIELMGLQ